MLHTVNIFIHVVAGVMALIVGVFTIFYFRKPDPHKRSGRIFLYLLAVVVSSGWVGWRFFRSDPFLLMLTLISGYVGFAGWRVVRMKTARLSWRDASFALAVLAAAVVYVYRLSAQDGNWSPSVIYPTVGALAVVTVYDLLKILCFHRYVQDWWVYEHIYKMMSAFSALLSAFAGTVLPLSFRPYSQVGPSILVTVLIIIFIRIASSRRRTTQKIMLTEK